MELIDFVTRRCVRGGTIAVTALAVALGGCALAISGPQPERARLEPPRCDTGKGAVVLDGVWGAALGVGGLSAIGNDEPEIGALVLATGALFIATAVRGNAKANECTAAFAAYSTEIATRASDDDTRLTRRPRRAPIAPRPASTAPTAPQPSASPAEAVPVAGTPAAPTPTPTPAPPARKAPFASPRPPRPAAPPPASVSGDADDWSEFWQEVP